MIDEKATKDRKVVIDAGAVIKGQRIERFGGALYTTAGVLGEIKDEAARNLLNTLPEELKIRDPLPADRAYAREFAKATGDYGFLSANDLDLISLTVHLCREAGVTLREKPKDLAQQTAQAAFDWAPAAAKKDAAPPEAEQPKNEETEKTSEGAAAPTAASTSAVSPSAPRPSSVSFAAAASEPAQAEAEAAKENEEESKPAAPMSWAAKAAAAKHIKAPRPVVAKAKPRICGGPPPPKANSAPPAAAEKEECSEARSAALELGGDGDAAAAAAAIAAALEAEESDEDEGTPQQRPPEAREATHEVEEDDEDGDSAGEWVTSDNMHHFGMTVATATEIKVTCASSDYSVQNVLLQMGITPLTFDGYAVRSVKIWGLICRACSHFTRDSEKVFCPKCGNDTVVRVPIVVGEDGQATVLNNGRPLRKKGTIFSMPKVQGGRAWKPIMSADEIYIGGRDRELRRAQKQAEKERAARDPFDLDNGAKDWYARSGVKGGGSSMGARMQAGYGRRVNPNANNFRGFRGSKK